MKLIDLRPSWVRRHNVEDTIIGVHFDCPRHGECTEENGCGGIHAPFENPIGPGAPWDTKHKWQRTGETFETLTLTPSIRSFHIPAGSKEFVTDWHGFVTNGEIITQ